MQAHTGERPYKCSSYINDFFFFCSQPSSNLGPTLLRGRSFSHELSVPGAKPFSTIALCTSRSVAIQRRGWYCLVLVVGQRTHSPFWLGWSGPVRACGGRC